MEKKKKKGCCSPSIFVDSASKADSVKVKTAQTPTAEQAHANPFLFSFRMRMDTLTLFSQLISDTEFVLCQCFPSKHESSRTNKLVFSCSPAAEKGEVRDGAGRDHLVLTAGTEATALQLCL
jgi:hypothetical protein